MEEEKIDKAKKLIKESYKLLLEVLVDNETGVSDYREGYIDKIYDASKQLLQISRQL